MSRQFLFFSGAVSARASQEGAGGREARCSAAQDCMQLQESPWKDILRKSLLPIITYMTHSQMLGKFEYTGGPIFKVVLEC